MLFAVLAAAMLADSDVYARMYGELLKVEGGYCRHHPDAGLVHAGHYSRRVPWPEHPSGWLQMNTNNLGLREDQPTVKAKKPKTRRLLVLGDSHTDGMVHNAESFPNLLEAAKKNLEVLNGGVTHTSFRDYLGYYRAHRWLKPDAVIVAVYTGNDFVEAAKFLELRGNLAHRKSYLPALEKAEKVHEGAVWQVLNQAAYFSENADRKDAVLAFSVAQLRELQTLCRKDKAKLLVVLIPTKMELERWTDRDRLDRLQTVAGLTDADLLVNAYLREETARRLKNERIPFVDLGSVPAPKPGGPALFWAKDYHLSVAGHRWVADQLLPKLP